MSQGDFENKVVLITGASSGIGEALAFEFHRQGAKLVLAARRLDRLQALAQKLGSERVLVVKCDVTLDGDLENVVKQATQNFGSLDVVVANAGFGVAGKVENLSLNDYRRQFETNVFGVIRTVHVSLEELKRSRGRIVLLGSVKGFLALPGGSAYAMSKFSVRALALALTQELKEYGIAVTHVAPGFVKSEIRQVDNQGERKADSKDLVPNWIQMPAQTAARQIVRATQTRRAQVIITRHGKLAIFLQSHAPGLVSGAISLFKIKNRTSPQ